MNRILFKHNNNKISFKFHLNEFKRFCNGVDVEKIEKCAHSGTYDFPRPSLKIANDSTQNIANT